jgi:glutamate dehydrogenase (NADP+)
LCCCSRRGCVRARQGRQRGRGGNQRAGDAAERRRATSWDFPTTEARLKDIMVSIHRQCVQTAEQYGTPGDYVNGANLAGFLKVADAMLAMGLV